MGAVWCSVYLMRMEWEHTRYGVYFCLPIKKKTKKRCNSFERLSFYKRVNWTKSTTGLRFNPLKIGILKVRESSMFGQRGS